MGREKMKREVILIAAIAAALIITIGGAFVAFNFITGTVEISEVIDDVQIAPRAPENPRAPEHEHTPQNGRASESDRTPAPDFTIEDYYGNEVKLSDMRGKPVVVNFWASWCPPCRAEMPDFNAVFEEIGENVHFMMINATDGARETKEAGAAFIEEGGYTFPVYYDIKLEAVVSYGIRAFPTTVFIDGDGYIVGAIEGMISEDTLRRGIDLASGGR
jgi:thiol-disulfide isomerase/thioredoxin